MTDEELAQSKTPQWIRELKQKYPMFSEIHPCNFGCGEGWKPIIQNLCEQIHNLEPTIKVVQIKEKFGSLRFYIDGSNSFEVGDLIDAAEKESSVTCEECGAVGLTARISGWMKTLCPVCEKLLKERNET